MKLLFPLLFSFLLGSCYFWKTPKTLIPEPYPLESEIDLYLSTEDPDVEKQVITRLKQHKILNEEVKKVLRKRPHETRLTSGLQLKLKIKYNGKNYPYALFIPSATKPETTFPLIVILHGMGSTGDSIIQKWANRLQGKFIILCPSYPMGAWWAKPAEEIVLQLIQKTKSEYPVDPNRVFLAGLSNGAIGTFTIGMFYPDYFAGIVPIAGSISKRLMHFLVNLNNTPIYIIHGHKDPVFPVAYQRRVHKILSDLKYAVVYREHGETGIAHGGHFLPEAEVAPLVQWLLRQNRRLDPKVVRMTREGNHMGAIQWARITKGVNLAALQIPGPEREPLNLRDGKIATMFAIQKGNNLIEILGRNLLGFEVFLNTDMVDFNIPVRITTRDITDQGDRLVPGETRVSFEQKVKPSLTTLLRGFKIRHDPDFLFDAVVEVSLEKTVARVWQP
ncbi:MAG: hypothetical protein VYC17_00175 [Nitrospinota bacterium]|nr:hypothetical protein [Nitrospinota bacterium]